MEEYTNYLVHHGVKGMKWGVRKQFQAAHRFRKSNKSNAIRVSKQYGDRIRGLEKRHEIEGEKIGDWGSTQGRKLMDRQYDEMKALKEEGRKAVNKAALLDAGYTQEQAEVGFKWMSDQEKKGSKYVMYKIKHSNEDDTFLVHHGVKGQKWGVRRYQNYDGTLKDSSKAQKYAKKQAKYLNELDRKRAHHVGYAYDYMQMAGRNNRTLARLRGKQSKKDKDSRSYARIQKKIDRVSERNSSIAKSFNYQQDRRAEIESRTNKIISQLNKQGITVSKKTVSRNARSNAVLFIQAITPGAFIDISQVQGTKYRIDKKKR